MNSSDSSQMVHPPEETYADAIKLWEEDQQIQTFLAALSKEPSLRKKIKKLEKFSEGCQSPLAQSHLHYCLNDYKRLLRKRRRRFVIPIGFLALISIACASFFYSVHKFYWIPFNNETYQKAVEYYEAQDYDGAQPRLKKLVENNCDGYSIYYYYSWLYEKQGEYDRAPQPLMHFLHNYYGEQNVTKDNNAYLRLKTLYYSNKLSSEQAARVYSYLEELEEYAKLYRILEEYMDSENYALAIHQCETLLSRGARNYGLTAAYAYCLCMEGCKDAACNYVLEYFDNLSSYEEHTVNQVQRAALVNLLMEFAEGENYEKCQTYRKAGWPDAPKDASMENTQYEIPLSPTLTYDVLTENFTQELDALEYKENNSIIPEKETVILNGHECYPLSIRHTDGALTSDKTFFYSRDKNYLYLLVDEQLVNLSPRTFSTYVMEDGLSLIHI